MNEVALLPGGDGVAHLLRPSDSTKARCGRSSSGLLEFTLPDDYMPERMCKTCLRLRESSSKYRAHQKETELGQAREARKVRWTLALFGASVVLVVGAVATALGGGADDDDTDKYSEETCAQLRFEATSTLDSAEDAAIAYKRYCD